MWYVAKSIPVENVGEDRLPHVAIGRCRKHAPTMNGYPVVYEHD